VVTALVSPPFVSAALLSASADEPLSDPVVEADVLAVPDMLAEPDSLADSEPSVVALLVIVVVADMLSDACVVELSSSPPHADARVEAINRVIKEVIRMPSH
jgi:hypothetical protein